jgi:hypothetical protein
MAYLAESAAAKGTPGRKAMAAAYATANDMATLSESARIRGALTEAWAARVAAWAAAAAIAACRMASYAGAEEVASAHAAAASSTLSSALLRAQAEPVQQGQVPAGGSDANGGAVPAP